MKGSVIAIIVIIIVIIAAAGLFAYTAMNASTTSSTTTPTTGTTSASITSSTSSTTSSSLLPSTTSSTTGSANSTVNIGIMEDQTGPIAGFAAETIAMAKVAVDQINSQGGVMGHPLKLYVADESSGAIKAAQSLVLQDNVVAVVGVSYTGDVEAIMPFLSQHQVLGIFTTATGNTLMNNVTSDYAAYKYFFRLTLQDSTYGQYLSQFFTNVTKPSSIYFVAEDLSFAHETFSSINQTATQMGIKVLGATFVPTSQTDFSTLVAQIASFNPAMVIDAQTGIGGATFLTALKANPSTNKIIFMNIANGALSDPAVMSSLQKSQPGVLNGTIFQQYPGTATKPYNSLGASLVSAYQQATNSTYYAFPSNSFTAIHLLAQAMTNANTVTNVSAIIITVEKIQYQGAAGLVTFDSNHNWVIPSLWYTQFQGNELQVILPSNYSTSAYQAP